MYHVLIVDDDEFALEFLGEQLKSYGDFFTPIYASTGQEAVEILSQQEIALLVTDLVMPGIMNGWALIEYIEEYHPAVPVVVITGCEDKKKLRLLQDKVRHVFLKPIKVRQLVHVVTNILNEDIASGSLNGVSVASFLQLLEMEGKTCLLEVATSPKDRGLLYINQGRLYDAVYGDYQDHEAACRLIALDNARFQIKALPKKKIRQRIKAELMAIIMEAMKLKDEYAARNGQGFEEGKGESGESDTVSDVTESIIAQASDFDEKNLDEGRNNQQTDEVIIPSMQKETNVMALETILENLRSINGYKASALMNFTGEILAADSVDSEVELANVGAVFNDIFRSSHEAAGKVGLQVCNELTMKTPNGLVIMACSGVDSPVHFHLIVVMDKDGNQALAKMQLDKMIPKFMDELS